MFEPNQLVIKMIDDQTRFVRRIVSKTEDSYMVSDPMFCCWGSVFAKWSKPKAVTKKHMERTFSVMTDTTLCDKYNTIQKGQSTSVLFNTTVDL